VKKVVPPSAAALGRVRALAGRRLSAPEFLAGVNAPMSDAERQEILDLIRWFRRRYQTPGERLAYIRRKYKEWSRSFPVTS
jgi:hypothetical protein